MRLHENKENFKSLIEIISKESRIESAILEKDYYVTMILQKLFSCEIPFAFKGGTSLSKCFHINKYDR